MTRVVMVVVAMIVLVAGPGLASASALTWLPKVCIGFVACNNAGMGNAGYQNEYTQSHWGIFAGHNCTNYTAYRLIKNGINASYLTGNGMAYQWGGVAASHGVAVDGSPRVGDIAWFSSTSGVGADGHVAYVESVDTAAGRIRVSEDNYLGDFDWRDYYIRDVSGFIHFGGGGSSPTGSFDSVASKPGLIDVAGWAFDRDNPTAAISVHVYVGGPAGQGEGHDLGAAALARPDVGAAYPGVGNSHGFESWFETGRFGNVAVYVYAINIGGGQNVLIGTKNITVQNPNPYGYLDRVAAPAGGGKVQVTGWAIDPNTPTTPTDIHVYVGGPAGDANAEWHYIGLANLERLDVGTAYPGTGNNHGFEVTFATSKRGAQPVFVYAINTAGGPGGNPLLGQMSTTIATESITATAPVKRDGCGTAHDTYTIPSTTGVEYLVGGVVKAAGSYAGSGSVAVTARAKAGYALTGTTSWSLPFTSTTCTATLALPATATPTYTTAKANAAWNISGATSTAGAITYDLQRRTVGVASTGARTYSTATAWLTLTTTKTATLTGSNGSVYQVRVRAHDALGDVTAWSGWYTVSMPKDDRTTSITGTWTSGTNSNYYAGTYRLTRAAKAAATQVAYTDKVTVIGAKAATTGKFTIYVDGVNKGTFDTYRSATAYRQPLATIALPYGKHTIKVVNLATPGRPALILDAIAYHL